MKQSIEQRCATARLYWQIGNWAGLADLELALDEVGNAPEELLLYKVQGLFQTGQNDEAIRLARKALAAAQSPARLIEALASGTHAALAQAWMFLDVRDAAVSNIVEAVTLHPAGGDVSTVVGMRFEAERSAAEKKANRILCRDVPARKLFVDCGGHDGCSAVMFLLRHPDFDCVTFEPNPALHKYYAGVPTQLRPEAAYTYNGEINFTIDPIDADGSSLIEGKRIDATKKLENAECPVINAPCIDLSEYIRTVSSKYDEIHLKMDIEGAEYDILEKMLSDGTLNLIDKLYCEFHVEKIPMDPKRHDDIVARASAIVGKIQEWNAHIFKTGDGASVKARRAYMLDLIENMRQNLFGERHGTPRLYS
ncbi:FkbM family methyltransferase [Sphingobium sp. WTD-1]|jgi:FkbM family methyltransferase|uniref:FkbM family methyltransferase n=1 Tax=Sphingobium sp. WTD-1 TaxID=2979467 RepID=UPI0024DEC40B|nr:FkbM family methyltransferase [Sphingobium sp. WTD-1]WIA56088.1 FkbM family methyltransferase [Sphingobium sp. WTD-1]